MAPVGTRSNKSIAMDIDTPTNEVKDRTRCSKRRNEDLVVPPIPPLSIIQPEKAEKAAKKRKPNEDILNFYDLGEILGSGGFSDVRKGTEKKTNDPVAIKVTRRAQLSFDAEKRIFSEVEILKTLFHPHIVRFKAFYQEDSLFYLVQEFVGGGELFYRIGKKKHYNEKEARDVMKILIHAIKYCHDRNIVHRDLKPENLVLQNAEDDTSLKLIDFGLATYTNGNDLTEVIGTPQFIAPEMLKKLAYGKAVDMWAIGVVLFCLLAGTFPFYDKQDRVMYDLIKRGAFRFDPRSGWLNVSLSAKDLICRLLEVDPSKRYTADQALEHEWMIAQDSILSLKSLKEAIPKIKRIRIRKLWQKVIRAIVALNRMQISVKARTSSKIGSATPSTPPSPYLIYDYEILQKTSLHVRKKALNNQTKQIISAKIVDLKRISEQNYRLHKQEIEVLKQLHHPNIITYYDSYIENNDHFHRLVVLTECIYGHELFDRVQNKREYDEKSAREIASTLLSTIQYIHEQGFVHRDLRPDHLYLTSDGYHATIKLIDFTYTVSLHTLQERPDLMYDGISSSPSFKAPFTSPEILQHLPYDQRTDVWSFGVIISFLLVGQAPSSSLDSPPDLPQYHSLSNPAKSFLQSCVTVDPATRITAADALNHPWFQLPDNLLSSHQLEEVPRQVRRHQIRKKFRVIMKALLLIIRVKRVLRERQEVFELDSGDVGHSLIGCVLF